MQRKSVGIGRQQHSQQCACAVLELERQFAKGCTPNKREARKESANLLLQALGRLASSSALAAFDDDRGLEAEEATAPLLLGLGVVELGRGNDLVQFGHILRF